MNNTLSVIMGNYNKERYIKEALEAILTQSYRPIEVIVIDDGSMDNSVDIIEEFVKKDPIVHLIKNERNTGIISVLSQITKLLNTIIRGDYFYLASSDDKILPYFFEKSINLLSKYPEAGLCSALSLLIDEEGKNKGLFPSEIISKEKCFLSPKEILFIFQKRGINWIMGNTTIYHCKALRDSGGFISELGSFTDGFITQVIALKYGACFIPEALACWRKMEGGVSSLISGNFDVLYDILNHAIRLMRSTYQDIFPSDGVNKWKKRQFYSLIPAYFSSQKRDIEKLINFLSPLSLFEKGYFFILHFFLWVGYFFYKIFTKFVSYFYFSAGFYEEIKYVLNKLSQKLKQIK